MSRTTVTFAQHIRTSSKARRGFRTLKRTMADINDQLDEKLGTYGVYTPTQYQDFQEMVPEDYPKLFMFYQLDKRRVLCKSTYVGEDLHSYPPRSGNYISHALVCKTDERFSPVDVFQNAQWVDKRDAIVAMDNIAGVDLDIEPLPIEIQLSTGYSSDCFHTILFNEHEPDNSRLNMFKQVVDNILLRKKIIIVDRRGMLQSWMFALLQIFPEEFIFRHLNIASFSSSNLLMEICNVLCFEPENIDKIRRNNDYSEWSVIDGNSQHHPSRYAEVLVKCIIGADGRDIPSFRDKVFNEFEVTSNFSNEEFDAHAWFFDELDKIIGRPDKEFTDFIVPCIKKETKLDAIFEEIKSKESWHKTLVFWKALRMQKATNGFEKYKHIHDKYYIQGITDIYWLEFEKTVVNETAFGQSLDALLGYYHVTSINDPSRTEMYSSKVEGILSLIKDPKDTIKSIQKAFGVEGLLTVSSKGKLNELLKLAKFRIELEQADDYQRIILLFDNQHRYGDDEIASEIHRLIVVVSWEIIFRLIKNGKDNIVEFLCGKAPNNLPNRRLALLLCNNAYMDKLSEAYDIYTKLSQQQQRKFLSHAPNDLQRLFITQTPIATLVELEQSLADFKELVDERLLVENFLNNAVNSEQLWFLCALLFKIPAYSHSATKYPNAIFLTESSKNLIYEKVDDTQSVNIPRDYYNVAELMRKSGKIKRNVPKVTISYSYDDLRTIGYLSDLKNIREKLKGKPFTEIELNIVVKKPWEYFCWKELCDQLTEAEKLQIPMMINEILDETKREKDVNRNFFWCNITCEYIVYVVKFGTSEEYRTFLSQIGIDWKEYDYILSRLSCIMTEDSNRYAHFRNENKKNRIVNRNPF